MAPDATLASGAEEVLFLTRKALRRYVKARIELAGAVSLLRDWFGAGAPESNTTAADALRVGAFMSGPKGDETSVADPTWDIAPGALLEDTERQPEPGYGRLGGSENPAGDGFRQIIKDQTGNWPKTPRAFVEAYIVRNKGNPRNLSANKCFKKWKNVGNTGYREVIREEFRNQMHDRGLEVTKGAPRKPVPE